MTRISAIRSHGVRSSEGEIDLDDDKIVKYLRARVPGLVIKRTREGKDIKGVPFKPYSTEYAKARLGAGRSSAANLWVTGGMVGSFALRSSTTSGGMLVLHFAPDAISSPSYRLAAGSTKQTGTLMPPHNVLGWYHHVGAGHLPRRRWMGLTPSEKKRVAQEIEDLKGVWRLA